MSSQATRDKLIGIIKEHQLSNGQSKLPIAKLADLAGISRQAFNRYYGDLKDYSVGKESVAKLFTNDNESLGEIIDNKESMILRLQQELAATKVAHKAELEAAISNHISTLMNNDIMAFEAGQITATLTGQSNHNAYLNKRVTELEVKNVKLTMEALSSAHATNSNYAEKSDKNFIVFGLDLSAAKKSYAASGDFDAYEDAKEVAVTNITKNLIKLPNPENIDIVLFQDKYISDFDAFCSKISPYQNRTTIVIRLPIYSREELQFILKDLQQISSISIHVPFTASETTTSANRRFGNRDIPPEELKDADNAKLPSITWGFEEVIVFRVRQGE
nr:hypothetical protein [Tanacetum cinerariifolium]